MFTYTQAKAIINELGRFEVESYDNYGMTVINTENGEYAIGTDRDADEAHDRALDNYIDECVMPELEPLLDSMSYGGYISFDRDSWKRDASYDGRGHSLSSYDGEELEIADLVAFRIN